MSVSYNVFIGPYIKVYSPEIDTVEEYHTCPNVNCKNHKQDVAKGFCPKCGTRIERTTRIIEEQVSFDYYDELGGNFNEITDYNNPSNYNRIFTSDIGVETFFDSDFEEIPMNETNLLSDINLLKTKYVKEISRIEEVFGKENVLILWGAILSVT